MSEVAFKRCTCGAEYTRVQWDGLQYVGLSDVHEGAIELRLCGSCRSTIAILVHPKRRRGAPRSAGRPKE